jgi:hypothetical protein
MVISQNKKVRSYAKKISFLCSVVDSIHWSCWNFEKLRSWNDFLCFEAMWKSWKMLFVDFWMVNLCPRSKWSGIAISGRPCYNTALLIGPYSKSIAMLLLTYLVYSYELVNSTCCKYSIQHAVFTACWLVHI